MKRVKKLLPRDKSTGRIAVPLFWPLDWLKRWPWWVGLPLLLLWFPFGVALHLLVMPLWWEEERKRG